MKLVAIIALALSSPADAEALNWLDVKVDSVEMRLPDLPRLSLHWPSGAQPKTLENVSSFILDRGVRYEASSPMDRVLTDLNSKVELGRITLISVGPRVVRSRSDNISCSEELVTVLEHDVSLFCLTDDALLGGINFSASLVSHQLRFFDSPVLLRCSYLRLSNDPFGVNCRLRSEMPNGLAVTVDLYLNETKDWAWPDLHGSLEDWQASIEGLETALVSMLVN